ncbi:MAG: helix-turn-helix transcriptional regulator, partial [Ruthenibacterium sp.]
YRQLKNLTQEQLGEKVGVRRETIMRLEAGKYNPSLKLAIEISRIVETPIEELFLFE